MKLWKYCVY